MFQSLKDSLINFVSGLGVFGKDPTTTSQYLFTELNRAQLENAYRSDWVARIIVDAPAQDATKAWRTWQADDKIIAAVENLEKSLYLQRKLRWAIIRARLYGGAGLVLGIDDGRNTWEPVDWAACKQGCLKFVVVLNRYELMAGPRIYNVFSEWYTRPEYYTVATPLFGFDYEAGGTYPVKVNSERAAGGLLPAQREDYGQNTQYWFSALTGNKDSTKATSNATLAGQMQEEGDRARQVTPAAGMVKIHPERVVELAGNEMPDWRLVPMGGWWGDSVLQTCDEMLKDFGLAIGGIANLINDAKLDVIGIPDLAKSLSNQEYATRLIQRFQIANTSKSMINALLLDKNEDWKRIQTSFSALPEIMREYMTIAGGAGGVPVSRMMGQSPGRGLSNSSTGGETDIRNYYDGITSNQETVYTPALRPLDRAIVISATGKDDDGVGYEWNALYEENPLEQAQTWLAKAQAFQIDVNAGLTNPEVLREARLNQLEQDDVYPGLDDAREEYGDEPEEPEAAPWKPLMDPKTGQRLNPEPRQPQLSQGGAFGRPALPGALPPKGLPGPSRAARQAAKDYSPDQPRDEHGRWTSGAGGGGGSRGSARRGAHPASRSPLPAHTRFGDLLGHLLSDEHGGTDFGNIVHHALHVGGHLGSSLLHEAAMHHVKDIAKDALIGAVTAIGIHALGVVGGVAVTAVASLAVHKAAAKLGISEETTCHALSMGVQHLIDHYHAFMHGESAKHLATRVAKLAFMGQTDADEDDLYDALVAFKKGLDSLKFDDDGNIVSHQTSSDYDPDQPRDERGMWTAGASASDLAQSHHQVSVGDVIASVPGAADKLREIQGKLHNEVPTDAPVSQGGLKGEDGNFTPEREAIHNQIIDRYLSPDNVKRATPDRGQAPTMTMLGGRGGSGKSWLISKGGPVDASKAIVINADDVQEQLPGYEGYKAPLYHEEAAHVADQIEAHAREAGLNVIHDATMRTPSSAARRVNAYKAKGYKVAGYYMHASPETAARRSLGRMLRTGRYVPPSYTLGSTTNEASFDQLRPRFDKWAIYDNEGDAPRLVNKGGSANGKVAAE